MIYRGAAVPALMQLGSILLGNFAVGVATYRYTAVPASPQGPRIPGPERTELRCPHCQRLLGRGDLIPGSRVQLKCTTGCRRISTFAMM